MTEKKEYSAYQRLFVFPIFSNHTID